MTRRLSTFQIFAVIEAPKKPVTTLSLPETEPTENNLLQEKTIEISKERQKNNKEHQEQNGIQGPLYDVIGSKKSQNRQNSNYFAASSSTNYKTCQSIADTLTFAAAVLQLLLMS